jgi:gas vesicle protein
MSNKNGFLGFLLGGIIGAAIGMMYAPRSGDETRQMLAENSQEMKDKAMRSVQEAQETTMASIREAQMKLEELNEEVMMRVNKLQAISKRTLEEQKETFDKGLKEASDVLETEKSTAQSDGGS